MKRILIVAMATLSFAGCMTSPFLSKDAVTRLAAVDALTEQRKLVEVALDYCTEPYQELPTGCQMDVRIRAVERLTDRDMLMAIASFSIVKTSIRGNRCCVTLGAPNPELRELALDKLTEGSYITSVLSAKKPFAIEPLFTKALFGYYQIDGDVPSTAESAWFKVAKGKERTVAGVFCNCMKANAEVTLCERVYALLPSMLSAETKSSIKESYQGLVHDARGVNDAVRALEIAAFIPSEAIEKTDIEKMCKKVGPFVSSAREFKIFASLVNGASKKYLSDSESIIENAARGVVLKLNEIDELAILADCIKGYKGAWVGEIGIEDAVRKCAGTVNNLGGIEKFAKKLSLFNTQMLPSKTEIAGDAVVAVLNAINNGNAIKSGTKDEKESISDFVSAVAKFESDLLSDKAIIAIFENKELNDAYSRAIRSDGYREDMGNEIASAAMKSGSFGDMLAAGLLMGAIGDKESPKFTKLYSVLVKAIRKPETFVKAASLAKIYYSRNMLIEAAEIKIDSVSYAKCLLAVFKNFPDSSWCIGKTLSSGETFVRNGDEVALSILQQVFHEYAGSRNKMVALRAIRCFNDAEEIEDRLLAIEFDVLEKDNCRSAYMASLNRVVDLYNKAGQSDKSSGVLDRMSEHLVKSMNSRCKFLKKPEFAFPRTIGPLMEAIGNDYPVLWAKLMLKLKIPSYSVELAKVTSVLESEPKLLVDFLCSYKCEPYVADEGEPLSNYNEEVDYLPVYYYDCEWYWNALCVASKMTLEKEDRDRLNKNMVFFAINGLELEARERVLSAIVGDADMQIVKSAWANARSNIPSNTTALFNLSLDESFSKMKKAKLWGEKFKNRRILLRGKVLDVGDSKLVLDGGSDVTDMKFVDKLPSSNIDPFLGFAVESEKRKLKSAEDNVRSAKRWYDSKKRANLPFAHEEEELKKAEAILAELKEKEARPLRVILKYTVEVPGKYADVIAEFKKGDEVMFEAYPYRVYPRSSTEDIKNRTRTFSAWMREGRIYGEKE